MENLIYAYTRKQAIEDGEQVDVSTTAAEAGIRFPVFLTRIKGSVNEIVIFAGGPGSRCS